MKPVSHANAETAPPWPASAQALQQQRFDIVVAGAGIAGAVAAETLNRVYPGLSIAVLEAGVRAGGRLRSRPLGEGLEPVELGGEYISSAHHRTLARAKALGLTLAPVNYIRARHHVRGRVVEERALAETAPTLFALNGEERGLSPTALFARTLAKLAPGLSASDGGDPTAALQHLRGLRAGGVALSAQTFQRATSAHLSGEAFAFVQACAGASEGLTHGNCANAIDTWLWEARPGQRFFRVREGAQELVARTLASCSARLSLLCLHKLTGVDWADGWFCLKVSTPAGARAVFARQLVLALTAQGLRELHVGEALRGPHWRGDLAGIGAVPAAKFALAFAPSWWERRGGPPARGAVRACLSDRGLHVCCRRASAGAALVTGLASGAASSFWASECARPSLSALQAQARRYVQEFWSAPEPGPPLGFDFADWTQLRGGGWHFWRCGADSQVTAARLRQPNRHKRLFVCGEVLAQRPGWIESAIENAEDMLERCFGAPRVISGAGVNPAFEGESHA